MATTDVQARLTALRDEIRRHDHLYYVKARPGKLNYGTFGPSSVQNMTMVDLRRNLERSGLRKVFGCTLSIMPEDSPVGLRGSVGRPFSSNLPLRTSRGA